METAKEVMERVGREARDRGCPTVEGLDAGDVLAGILAARTAYADALRNYQTMVCRAVLVYGIPRGRVAKSIGVRPEVVGRMVAARVALDG